MAKGEPRLVTMKEFRESFGRLTEPVRVVRARGQIEILGTWIPEEGQAHGALRAGDEGQRRDQQG